jgi:hypothetical protein
MSDCEDFPHGGFVEEICISYFNFGKLHASRWDLMARDQVQPHFVEISFFSNSKVQQQNP